MQIEGNPHCCFFNFSPKIMFTKVVKAQLWVYLRPVQHTSTVYLQILRLKPVTEEGSRHIRIRSLKIDLNSRIGHWQSIDFKHVLQNWFKQPQNNWGIEINAFDPNGNDLAVTSLGPGAEGLVRWPARGAGAWRGVPPGPPPRGSVLSGARGASRWPRGSEGDMGLPALPGELREKGGQWGRARVVAQLCGAGDSLWGWSQLHGDSDNSVGTTTTLWGQQLHGDSDNSMGTMTALWGQ